MAKEWGAKVDGPAAASLTSDQVTSGPAPSAQVTPALTATGRQPVAIVVSRHCHGGGSRLGGASRITVKGWVRITVVSNHYQGLRPGRGGQGAT